MRGQISTALKEALKSGDQTAVATLRLINAALKDRDIAARGKGNADGISDDDILGMLQTMIKQRQESAKLYRDGGRPELADQEEREITIIRGFMPEQMDEEAIADAISTALEETEALSVKDMGKVMAHLKSAYSGQMDFAIASRLTKQKLMK